MRAVLILLLFALGACSRVPNAPQLPKEAGFLPQATTRQLVEHWAGKDYPTQISGRPIQLVNQHPDIAQIDSLTPARKFSRNDRTKNRLGTLAMVHPQQLPENKQITDKAWQITSQPATIVARTAQDGSLTLTALDFRDENQFQNQPLARNHRMPFDFIEDQENSFLSGLFALVDPAGWSDRRGFYLATEYDPEKIPLIFVHGLLSTPLDFEQLASAIASEPDLWDRYQLWYYFYPSGDPWIITAAHFREDFRNLANTLDPEKDDHPLRKETTLIAHSMGGLISRLSVSEDPEKLYSQYFNRPLDEIRLIPYQKQRIRDQLLFEPLTEPAKIIFLATPHKGSKLAEGPLYWLAKSLIRAPARIIGTTLNTAQLLVFAEPGLLTQHGSALLAGNELSVTGLRSDSVALKALNEMTPRKDVELHNIVATVTGTEQGFGDWVVPYGSASLEQADSQTIVRSGHWLTRDPETAKAVIKILRK